VSAAKGAPDLVLKATAITRRFGGLVAVNKVDFEIPRGMIAAIIGPNGAGKTTFFNVVAGIYAPTEGHIEINGKRLISPPTGASREPALLLVPLIPFIGLALYFLLVVGGLAGLCAPSGTCALSSVSGSLALHVQMTWWKLDLPGPSRTFVSTRA